MGIYAKVLSLGGISLFSGVFILIFSHMTITGTYLNQVEEALTRDKGEQIQRILEGQWQDLGNAAEDWAYWDPSVEFLKGREPDYAQVNLNAEAFRALWLDTVVYFRKDLSIHWAGHWGGPGKPVIELDNFQEYRNLMLDLMGSYPSGRCQGYIRSSSGWVLLALRPVLPVMVPGESPGYLMFTRKMDQQFWTAVSKMSGLELTQGFPRKLRSPGAYVTAQRFYPGDTAKTLLTLGVPDLRNINSLEVTGILDRNLEETGFQAALQSALLFCMVLIITTVFGVLVFNKVLVVPLTRVTRFIDQLGATGDYTMRLPPGSKDEIGVLFQGVNGLVTAVQERTARLESLAATDSLTGLANRRMFDQALDLAWRLCRREKAPLGIIMADVDYFKKFNDAYGHSAGDACLKAVAYVIGEEAHRPGDIKARYGGEEFSLLLPNTDSAGVALVAERIRSSVQNLGIPHGENPEGVVTMSLGWVCLSPGEGNPWDEVKKADEALYRAKKQGRNRVSGPS